MKQKIEIFFCERECFEKGSNISGGTETRVLSETAEAHKSTLDQERQDDNVTCHLTVQEMVLDQYKIKF